MKKITELDHPYSMGSELEGIMLADCAQKNGPWEYMSAKQKNPEADKLGMCQGAKQSHSLKPGCS